MKLYLYINNKPLTTEVPDIGMPMMVYSKWSDTYITKFPEDFHITAIDFSNKTYKLSNGRIKNFPEMYHRLHTDVNGYYLKTNDGRIFRFK